jgi:hypothetical protein
MRLLLPNPPWSFREAGVLPVTPACWVLGEWECDDVSSVSLWVVWVEREPMECLQSCSVSWD